MTMSIDTLKHQEISNWLRRALDGQETLPRLTIDEPNHFGILRLTLTLEATTRLSIWKSCIDLLREFCETGLGNKKYLQELLFLSSAHKDPEIVPLLLLFTEKFLRDSNIDIEIRQAVLATLIDTSPPQPIEFWDNILQTDKENYSGMVLSGFLEINPMHAIKLLPSMPNNENIGQISALNLDLALDELRGSDRTDFIKNITSILKNVQPLFSAPIRLWLNSIGTHLPSSGNLNEALEKSLGKDSSPRTLTTKICTS